jgi:hypothetical protein
VRRLSGVAVAAVLLAGCTTRAVVLDGARRSEGIETRAGRPGVVVAAPHGASDRWAGEMAAEIAARTGFGLVVARDVDVPARPPAEATRERAAYQSYERRVREASREPLRFYVELLGSDRRESADRIEIATVGVDAETAVKLRTLLELVRDAHIGASSAVARLQVRVEPADAVSHAISRAKRDGIVWLPQRALHIDLPRAARREGRQVYTLILSDFLREAVDLPPPPPATPRATISRSVPHRSEV